jgi:hypothetical protein
VYGGRCALADEINEIFVMSLFQARYKHARNLVNGILFDINILSLFPRGVSPIGLYINKIFGFNCAMESHLKRIELQKNLWIYKSSFFSYIVGLKYINKSKVLEIDADSFRKKHNPYPNSIDILYVATLENYAKTLLIHAQSHNNKDKNIVFFLPIDSKNWHCLPKIEQEFKVIYPYDIGLSFDEYSRQFAKYKKIIQESVGNIKKDRFSYRGVSYFGMVNRSVFLFLTEFVSANIVLINAIHSFFKQNPPSELYIARDRRATENSFVQVLGVLGTNTHMIMHGVITSNYDQSQLFTSHYRYVNCVHIWGEQQLRAIIKKQKGLNEKIPIIIKDTNKFDLMVHCENTVKNLIVIIGTNNDSFMYKLSKKLANLIDGSTFKVVFRPHPDNISDFKEIKNLKIDKSGDFAFSVLPKAFLVITHSSTMLLEGIAFGAGCVLLNYPEFNKKFPSIYEEECDFINNNKYVLSDCDDKTLLIVNKCISSKRFMRENMFYSNKIYSWFVG